MSPADRAGVTGAAAPAGPAEADERDEPDQIDQRVEPGEGDEWDEWDEAGAPTGPASPIRPRPVGALLVAGAAGLAASGMLTVDRFALLQDPQTALACDLSPFVACGPVMESAAGALFGFPNPLLGLVGFTLVLTTGVVLAGGARLPRWYWRGLQVGVLAAAVLVTWLQTQSLYVIGALCLWCLLVWTVTIPLVVVVTLHNAAAGNLGPVLRRAGRALAPYTVSVVVVWYLVVLGAVALRFHRDFALLWF